MLGVPGHVTGRGGQRSFIIERTYPVPVDDLWTMWTTKDGFESWWGPDGYRVEVQVIEARIGGALEYEMSPINPSATDGEVCETTPQMSRARFSQFELHRRLMLTHLMDFIPGADPYEHDIEVDFNRMVGATSMIVTVHPHHDAVRTSTAVRVFLNQLEKLDRLLAGKTSL